MPSADIVIVNWNSGEQLRECLSSIDFRSEKYPLRVVVVDNNSADQSIAMAEALASPTRIIMAGENLGFGKACNVGARIGSGDYLLFLNPDTRLGPETVVSCISYLQSEEGAGVGVLGPQLVDETDHIQRGCARFPTWWNYLGKSLGLNEILPKLFPPVQLLEFDHLITRDVDHVIGAAYFIRRRLFEDLGGFDERFFVYLEDLDLSLRVRQAGWRVVYFAEARAYHKGGGTSQNVTDLRLYYSVLSRMNYARKHFSGIAAWLVIASACGPEFISRLIRAVFRRSGQEARDTIHAYRMLYAALPKVLGASQSGPSRTY